MPKTYRTPPPSAQEKKDVAKERREALLANTGRLLEDIDYVLAGYAEAEIEVIKQGIQPDRG